MLNLTLLVSTGTNTQKMFLQNSLLPYVHCITLYYAQQEISWKPGKTSKFRPLHSTIQIWTDFHENEAKKNFFLKKKIQNGRFFKIAIFQNRQFSKLFRENFTDWSLG